MIKKILFSSILFSAILFLPKETFAQEVQVCTQLYGGGVVCGAQAPVVHAPVKTAIGGIEPSVIGGAFMLTSGTFLYISRRLRGKKF